MDRSTSSLSDPASQREGAIAAYGDGDIDVSVCIHAGYTRALRGRENFSRSKWKTSPYSRCHYDDDYNDDYCYYCYCYTATARLLLLYRYGYTPTVKLILLLLYCYWGCDCYCCDSCDSCYCSCCSETANSSAATADMRLF